MKKIKKQKGKKKFGFNSLDFFALFIITSGTFFASLITIVKVIPTLDDFKLRIFLGFFAILFVIAHYYFGFRLLYNLGKAIK